MGVESSGLACRDCRGVDIRKLPHLAGRGASQTETGVMTKILALGFQGKRAFLLCSQVLPGSQFQSSSCITFHLNPEASTLNPKPTPQSPNPKLLNPKTGLLGFHVKLGGDHADVDALMDPLETTEPTGDKGSGFYGLGL